MNFVRFALYVALVIMIIFTGLSVAYKTERLTLECTQTGESEPSFFLDFEFLPAWVLWATDDGNLWLERSDGFLGYFSEVDATPRYIRFYYEKGEQLGGEYSPLSGRLDILDKNYEFNGFCEER